MKKKIYYILFYSVIAFACRTGRNYTSQDPDLYKVKIVAILPVKVIYSGNQPKDLTKTQLDTIAEKDGLLYQKSLNNNLLSRSGGKNRIAGVNYQAVEKTNSILKNKMISMQQLDNMDPDEIAKILGVDAVLKMEINSHRIMSDLANLGLGVLGGIINNTGALNNTTLGGVLNSAEMQNRTGDITTFATLIYNGKTLWNSRYQQSTEWDVNAQMVVEHITAAMGRNFPY
jgi:hypothetical protein